MMSETSACPTMVAPTASVGHSRRLSHPIAFAAITAILILFTAASSAPSPLYVVYQREWGFSVGTLTVVFAAYVVGLITSLLVIGALSDHVGRRPVLAAAVALEAVALTLFLTAGDVTVLLVARVIQGIATGAAMTTLGATLVDLNPAHSPGRAGLVNGVAPISGLALGALGCGALVQFAPAPTRLVFVLLLGGRPCRPSSSPGCPRRPRGARVVGPHSFHGSDSRWVCVPTSTRSSPSWWPAGRSVGCTSPSARRWPLPCSA